MHHTPAQPSSKSNHHKNSHLIPSSSTQHGHSLSQPLSLLLALPSESLTHITSYLEPVTLFSLARVNKHMYEHVKNDNTWLRAFAYQFLGIKPESDLQNIKSILLRRIESSWRKEFIIRWTLRRRWERSRNTTVMHVPHHSNISSMHLMSESGLLTSSLFYGIVSRSVPLTGKIHKGFIDAAGTGLGIGNPNVEFSPDVTACAITSEGATARVLWGFRSGAVAVTTAPRAVHNSRPTSRLVRCTVSEQHNAQVSDVVWTPDQALCVTGAADGTVKLWDAKEVRCFWTSPKHEGPEVPSPYVKVAINVSSGVVAGAKANGEITAWAVDFSKGVPSVGRNVSIPSPQEGSKVVPTTLSIDTSDAKPVLLITFTDDRYLYRVNLDFSTGAFQRAAFGEESSGAIRSVYAAFAKKEGESSFVVSGDQMGFMRIFDWRTGSIISRIEVNEDGTPVTALALNECVLVSGSELGVTRVWDALTLAHLRHIQPITTTARFSPNIGQGVSNIVLERDMVVASVGARVMSWKAGPVSSHIGKPLVKGQKSAKRIGGAKGYVQHEMKREIRESAQLLKHEQAQTRRQYGREREQRDTLSGLGLSEAEAVDYVLQLSRDEEEERRAVELVAAMEQEEGVFHVDFDDDFAGETPIVERTEPMWSTASFSDSSGGDHLLTSGGIRTLPPSPPHASSSHLRSPARMIPVVSSSPKAQVPPCEPTEAGFGSSYIRDMSMGGHVPRSPHAIPSSGDEHFPPMSCTPSSASASSTPSTPSVMSHSMPGSPNFSRAGSGYSLAAARNTTLASPTSPTLRTSAWGSPRRGSASSSSSSVNRESLARDMTSFSPRMMVVQERSRADDEDEDLKFAIELSLAEARSRGEAI